VTTFLRVYLPLTLLSLLTWVVSDWLEPKPFNPGVAKNDQRPDTFAGKFTKITMSDSGKPKNQLNAEAMVHYKKHNRTELARPVFVVFDEDQPPWRVASETGVITASGKKLFLGGTVHITRDSAPGIKPIVINTRDLNITPKKNFAETDEFAELISNRNRISGVGLKLYFGEQKKVRLLSNVRGKYEAR